MTTIEERLAEQLDAKDAELVELRKKIVSLECQLDSQHGSWTRHRKVDDVESLPVPRLEIEWTMTGADWTESKCEYRLVMKHLLGHCIAIPLGMTTQRSGNGIAPWIPLRREDGLFMMPFRDGAHSLHDSAHLRLPLYGISPDGTVRIDACITHGGIESTLGKGAKHRREDTNVR